MSNLTSLQSVSEAQNFTRSATLPQKAWSTSTKPMKTVFPRAGPWLSPEARMKSTPSETMVKGACRGSMTFGWASMTWSQKASLSTSMGLPSPSSTGTRHSLTVASGKIVPSSPSQLRASGVTRPVTAARGTYVSSPSLNSPFSGTPSQKDRSWFTGWWFSRMVQNCHRGGDVPRKMRGSQACYHTVLWFLPSTGIGGSENNHSVMYTLLKQLLQKWAIRPFSFLVPLPCIDQVCIKKTMARKASCRLPGRSSVKGFVCIWVMRCYIIQNLFSLMLGLLPPSDSILLAVTLSLSRSIPWWDM